MAPAKRVLRRSNRASKAAARSRRATLETSWIRTLAAPYLRGFRSVAVARGPLRGYRFAAPENLRLNLRAGFFVGYLVEARGHEYLSPILPECLVFAYFKPVSSQFYKETVAREGSPLRKTAEYIGWLTHRPPRFVFFDDRETVLLRHFSMKEWPARKYRHYAGNFFIETLAWLVRSGLVAKLRGERSKLSA